jgi:hypothetical protein
MATTYAERMALIRSNIETHGLRFAFAREYLRLIRAGRPEAYAFNFACLLIFGRCYK